MPNPNPDSDLLRRVSETSLRMMAGVVSRDVVEHLQARIYAEPASYPWSEVVDGVLREPIDAEELVNKGLVGQRNWLLRGGRDVAAAGPAVASGAAVSQGKRRPSLKLRSKTLLAKVIVTGSFFLIYTVTIVLVLVLLRQHYPSFDIYRILEWLRDLAPSIFPR